MSFFAPTPFRRTYLSQSIANSLREHVSSVSAGSDEEGEGGGEEGGMERSIDIDDDAVSFSGDPIEYLSDSLNDDRPSVEHLMSSYDDEGPMIEGVEENNDDDDDDDESVHQSFSFEYYDDDALGPEDLIDMEILANEAMREEERYSVFSKESNILFNPQIEKERREGNPAWTVFSESTWRLLESLALPKATALLTLYVRHCVYVTSGWLQRILEELQALDTRVVRSAPRLPSIPDNFAEEIRPKIQSILYKVQQRRWLCSISKKYQDGICNATHCPSFRYVNDKLMMGEESEGMEYSLYFVRSKNRQGGDPYREVKKEVNISATLSINSQKMVPILWALEMRLLAILYIHDEWITDRRTAFDFPHLNDSRTLYSIHNPSLCEKPIMQYNVKEIRDALGRLHWRWNDMRPSDDLIAYFKVIKDRCALLSICAKIETIRVNTAIDLSITSGTSLNSRNSRNSTGSSSSSVAKPTASGLAGKLCPWNIDTDCAFSHFIGSNQQHAVLTLCSDLLFSNEEQEGEGSRSEGGKVELSSGAGPKTQKKSIAQFLAKRRRINQKIQREIRALGSGFSSLHDQYTVSSGDAAASHGKNGKGHIYGDVESQPRMVRVNLNRGSDLLNYSSSEEEDEEYAGDTREKSKGGRSIDRMLSKHPKGKKKRRGGGSVKGGDDNFFASKSRMDASMYKDFGKKYTDKDICDEILTRSILSSVPKLCLGNMSEKQYEDVEDFLENAFMRSLNTSSHLHKPKITRPSTPRMARGSAHKRSRGGLPKEFSATCVTRTNESFLVETHAMMCEMDEEIFWIPNVCGWRRRTQGRPHPHPRLLHGWYAPKGGPLRRFQHTLRKIFPNKWPMKRERLKAPFRGLTNIVMERGTSL
jgi:hypothetical protein